MGLLVSGGLAVWLVLVAITGFVARHQSHARRLEPFFIGLFFGWMSLGWVASLTSGIPMANLLFGWAVLGWMVALAWDAAMPDPKYGETDEHGRGVIE